MSTASDRAGRETLYRPLDWVLARTPLLPVEEYRELRRRETDRPDRAAWPTQTAPGALIPDDPRVHRALQIGGGDLTRALGHPPSGDRARRKLAGKLLRYLIRMSTRPTPYGLFAGVFLAQWDDHTDLTLTPERPVTRTRPDMGWLMSLVAALELRPQVRTGLRWFANPAVLIHAGRVFLAERAPNGGVATASPTVSLRATQPVRRALAITRTPVSYQRLRHELMTTSGATEAKVDRLIKQLWEHTVLLTDLRPSLTTGDPARHVAARLADIPSAQAEAAALTELLDALGRWDRLDAQDAIASYPELVAHAHSMHAVQTAQCPLQVDMARTPASRRVNRAVAVEAARAAELLLRLSPLPHGPSHLDAYRRAFHARYGPDREVLLLELLHPEVGLGPPGHAHGGGFDDAQQALRQRTLRNLALDAIRDRQLAVELDDATLTRLQTWPVNPAQAPTSLDVSVFVAAQSAEAIDAGDFCVVVGPNLGASAAGRGLGRFADLLGPDAQAALSAAARAEAVARPGRLWAEVVYLPWRARSANVAIRPLVREGELVLGTTASAPADRFVPIGELTVSVRDNRFVIRWPARDLDVMPCAGHMLNPGQAPAIVRFLDELSRDGQPQLSAFNWGPAAGFPFLPRVCAGRVVLAPATWRLDADTVPVTSQTTFTRALATWRARWQVPRYLYLTAGDNRLLLDLDSPDQLDQLQTEIRRLPTVGRLVLQEALPGPDQAWLTGSDGHYLSEFVVPLVVGHTEPPPERASTPTARPRATASPAHQRVRLPGSEWLFAKLYHLPTFEDDLIGGALRTFCTQACAAGLVDDWFFLRYADPERHLRIRLHGDPGLLATAVAPRLFRWAAELVSKGHCHRLCLDTYDPELERYGGPGGMAVSEKVFGVDSRAVADLLSLAARGIRLDTTLLAARTVDDMLTGLGFDETQRVDWYRHYVPDRRASSYDYRRRQTELRRLLGDTDWLRDGQPDGDQLARVLTRRRTDIELLAAQFDDLSAREELWQPKHQLARSLVHLHCNRLLGAGPPTEHQILGLLLRTRESLLRAPM